MIIVYEMVSTKVLLEKSIVKYVFVLRIHLFGICFLMYILTFIQLPVVYLER